MEHKEHEKQGTLPECEGFTQNVCKEKKHTAIDAVRSLALVEGVLYSHIHSSQLLRDNLLVVTEYLLEVLENDER